jgi:hypothetical protein
MIRRFFKKEAQKTPKIYLRFSENNDTEKLAKFYADHKHKDVFDRSQTYLQERIDTGDVILMEDEAGEIIGASVIYPLKGKDEHGRDVVKCQELGSLRIVKNGYMGLFNILISTQVFRTMLVEPPEECIVAEIHKNVWPLAKNIGAIKWEPSKEVIESSDTTLDPEVLANYVPDTSEDGKKIWIQIPKESLPTVAQKLLEVVDRPVLKHKKFEENGEKIEISLERVKFVDKFMDEIKAIAASDLGDPEKASPKQEMAALQRRWMKGLR